MATRSVVRQCTPWSLGLGANPPTTAGIVLLVPFVYRCVVSYWCLLLGVGVGGGGGGVEIYD